ncbi:cilia- and flagella-associated protein 36 [Tribolium madens]|uniref:cilia- and flagella-associated protein 36 n=1 Tax=Tribolium madens TaxID=41895 RepID=UPI001CF74C82|nr:cilia- and flagella-associated protein 36 [Tribolium madens]XP_044263850.1 cilia- and flagella-associated protein 36 [Tribolium madens]
MEDENSWVFDSLVAFLNGPIWSAPLDSFIEEKSLIFEPNVTDNEEYKNIFDEFKNLVDFMLGSFMEDIGITPDQFEEACNKGYTYHVSFNKNIFEQIWAANDYEMFKRMMTQRNVELQLEALELIERKYGITPQSFLPKKKDDKVETAVTIEKSSDFEKEILNEVAKNFPKEEASSSKPVEEVQYILEEKEILEKALKKTKELKVIEEKVDVIKTETKAEINYDRKQTEINPVELQKRQEYLRAQRDKLVALKKEARKKHLGSENGTDVKTKIRPKSAKAAEAVLSGEKPESQQLQLRKALAERLKTEVVSNKI